MQGLSLGHSVPMTIYQTTTKTTLHHHQLTKLSFGKSERRFVSAISHSPLNLFKVQSSKAYGWEGGGGGESN